MQKQVDYLHTHPDCRIVYTKFSNFNEISEDELGERKKALFERLITPGETVFSALSEQEIRALFQ